MNQQVTTVTTLTYSLFFSNHFFVFWWIKLKIYIEVPYRYPITVLKLCIAGEDRFGEIAIFNEKNIPKNTFLAIR